MVAWIGNHRPLPHGGDLHRASREYGVAEQQWLDLSTGINPVGWPVPAIPDSLWQQLPREPETLLPAAAQYYGCSMAELLAIPGSQRLINELPGLLEKSRVAVPEVGYAEHAAAWQNAGHLLCHYPANATVEQLLEIAGQCQVMVIINPNNPTADRYSADQLLSVARHMQQHQGLLVVDEAFMDLTPEQSLAPFMAQDNLLVLRSLGKFFGLAGARVGFALANEALLAPIAAALGPWTISGPALYLAERALADQVWQTRSRHRLQADAARLHQLLSRYERGRVVNGGLFVTCWWMQATELHEQLARNAVWTRLLDNRQGIRFGLPGSEAAWARLQQALQGTL